MAARADEGGVMEAGAIKATDELTCTRGQVAGKRRTQYKFPRLCSPEKGSGQIP